MKGRTKRKMLAPYNYNKPNQWDVLVSYIKAPAAYCAMTPSSHIALVGTSALYQYMQHDPELPSPCFPILDYDCLFFGDTYEEFQMYCDFLELHFDTNDKAFVKRCSHSSYQGAPQYEGKDVVSYAVEGMQSPVTFAFFQTSASTGFRAPSLGQSLFSSIATINGVITAQTVNRIIPSQTLNQIGIIVASNCIVII